MMKSADFDLKKTIFHCNRMHRTFLSTAVLLIMAVLWGFAQGGGGTRRPNRPVPTKPFRIIGNIYYVGQTDNSRPGTDDASFLITTPEGHILLDIGEEETVQQIRDNVQGLGFRLEDIKFLIHSHAHRDHVAGDALMKEVSPGIQLLVMEGDADVIASGGRTDFDPNRPRFRPAQPDQILKDGEQIQLGDTSLVAHWTPGHTKGCTTWTMVVEDGGRTYNAAFVCSARYSPSAQLVDNERYPNIAEDYARTYRILKSLTVDVFLASHGNFFGLTEKAKRLEQGENPNPFIDPEGYRAYIDKSEGEFLTELRKLGGTL